MQKIDFKNKKTQLITGALVVLAAVGGYWWYKKDKDDTKSTAPSPKETPKPLPALSTELAAVVDGALDYATPDEIIGWGGNKSTLKPIALDVYIDDKKVDTITVDDTGRTERQDITEWFGGGNKYGYAIPTPSLSAGTHTVSVKYAGTSTQVQNSPKTITI